MSKYTTSELNLVEIHNIEKADDISDLVTLLPSFLFAGEKNCLREKRIVCGRKESFAGEKNRLREKRNVRHRESVRSSTALTRKSPPVLSHYQLAAKIGRKSISVAQR